MRPPWSLVDAAKPPSPYTPKSRNLVVAPAGTPPWHTIHRRLCLPIALTVIFVTVEHFHFVEKRRQVNSACLHSRPGFSQSGIEHKDAPCRVSVTVLDSVCLRCPIPDSSSNFRHPLPCGCLDFVPLFPRRWSRMLPSMSRSTNNSGRI